MRRVAARGSAGTTDSPPPWWDGPGLRPPVPWPTGDDPAGRASRPAGYARERAPVPRAVGAWRAVLLALGVLVGVLAAALAGPAGVRGTGARSVTTPFLSYSPPPGWSAVPGATTGGPALVGVSHGPGYPCGAEESTRGFAGAALLPVAATAGPADRAERMARWFATTSFSASDGTPPDVAVAPPRPVRVRGPGGPVDGTVTEAAVRAPPGRDGCAAAAGRVLVLAVPASGGAALLIVAGDTAGGPAEPGAPDPSALEAVIATAELRTS